VKAVSAGRITLSILKSCEMFSERNMYMYELHSSN